MQTKLYKIPQFGINQACFDWNTAIEIVKIYKELMYGHPDAAWKSVWMTLHFLVNFDVFRTLRFYIALSIKTNLINTKLGDFVSLGVLFLTILINSCLSHNLQTRTYLFTVWNQAMLPDFNCELGNKENKFRLVLCCLAVFLNKAKKLSKGTL